MVVLLLAAGMLGVLGDSRPELQKFRELGPGTLRNTLSTCCVQHAEDQEKASSKKSRCKLGDKKVTKEMLSFMLALQSLTEVQVPHTTVQTPGTLESVHQITSSLLFLSDLEVLGSLPLLLDLIGNLDSASAEDFTLPKLEKILKHTIVNINSASISMLVLGDSKGELQDLRKLDSLTFRNTINACAEDANKKKSLRRSKKLRCKLGDKEVAEEMQSFMLTLNSLTKVKWPGTLAQTPGTLESVHKMTSSLLFLSDTKVLGSLSLLLKLLANFEGDLTEVREFLAHISFQIFNKIKKKIRGP